MLGKTAIVIGATGLVGRQVLQELLSSPDYERVFAVVRRPVLTPHPKLVTIVTTFDNLENTLTGIQADDAFCCLGTTIRRAGTKAEFHRVDYGFSYAAAHRMKALGTKHFLLVSAVGADAGSSVFYSRVKGHLEKDITALGFESLSVFRPSLLLGERQEHRMAEALSAKFSPIFSPLFMGPLERFRPIESVVVARAMVAAAKQSARGRSVYFYRDMQALA